MREEIYYTDLEYYTNEIAESNFLIYKNTFTDSYEESVNMIYSLYQERLYQGGDFDEI